MIQAPVVRFCFVLAVCARGGNTSLKGQFWPFMQPCLLGVPSAAWRHADRRIGNLLGGASLRPSQNKINCCAGSYGIFHSILWDKKKEPGFSKCSVYSGNILNFRKHLYGTARTAVPSADFVISRNNFIVMKKQRRGNRSGISFWISREILFTNHI